MLQSLHHLPVLASHYELPTFAFSVLMSLSVVFPHIIHSLNNFSLFDFTHPLQVPALYSDPLLFFLYPHLTLSVPPPCSSLINTFSFSINFVYQLPFMKLSLSILKLLFPWLNPWTPFMFKLLPVYFSFYSHILSSLPQHTEASIVYICLPGLTVGHDYIPLASEQV